MFNRWYVCVLFSALYVHQSAQVETGRYTHAHTHSTHSLSPILALSLYRVRARVPTAFFPYFFMHCLTENNGILHTQYDMYKRNLRNVLDIASKLFHKNFGISQTKSDRQHQQKSERMNCLQNTALYSECAHEIMRKSFR